jgi:hypothetical protein
MHIWVVENNSCSQMDGIPGMPRLVITIGSVFTVTVMMIEALTMILFSQYRKSRLRI